MIPRSISIVRAGYVGLCTAVGFTSKGYRIITYDRDFEKVALINKGMPPFYELGLEGLLQRVVREGLLRCTSNSEEAVLNTDITFITVGMPSKPNGGIDLQYVEGSAREIGEALSKKETYHLVVVKSTVIPGTTENIVKPTIENRSSKRCGVDFGFGYVFIRAQG